MKLLKTLYFMGLTLFLTSCGAKQIALNKPDYYTDKEVAVIIYKPTSSTFKTGSQGLLDMAVTPLKKYNNALKAIDSVYRVKLDTALINEVKKIYDYTNKKYIIIENITTIPTVIKDNKETLDLDYIKNTYHVDQVQVISPSYGIVSQYQGFIETDRNATIFLESTITDLKTHMILQQYNKQSKVKIKSKWKNNDYALLKESFDESLKIAIKDFNSQF